MFRQGLHFKAQWLTTAADFFGGEFSIGHSNVVDFRPHHEGRQMERPAG